MPVKPKIDENIKPGKENRDLLGKVITMKNMAKNIKPHEELDELKAEKIPIKKPKKSS